MNSLSTCSQNHTAISWDHNDSVACPMCSLIEKHWNAMSDMKYDNDIAISKLEEERDNAMSDYENESNRADSLERDNSALEDDIADLESRIKDLEAEIETGEV